MSFGSLARVLFVGAFPAPGVVVFGGMVTSCRALLASSLPRRVKLDAFDSTQIANPPPALLVRLLQAAARFLRFLWRFEMRRPDIVLLFVAVGASIVEKGTMARYARLRGVPVIMFPRGGSIVDDCRRSTFTRTWARFCFRGANRICCQGESWRRFAIETLGFSPGDVAVISNWTVTPELLALGDRVDCRPAGPVRLLFVGWLTREKGIFDLLEACRRLRGKYAFELDIAGAGEAMEEARALVARESLGGIIRFRGWLAKNDLHLALRDSDVFVLPSWGEGFPNSMIEAMAAGVAVIVTRVGAIPEVITDRVSGLLTDPSDVESLTRALGELIENAALRRQLAAQARAIAARDFAVEAAVDRIVAEIERTIRS